MTSGQFIDQLKKDLEKVNEQLETALSQEKARQLRMMQEAMQKRLVEAEELHKREVEELKVMEEAEKARKEAEAKEKREVQEKMEKLRTLLSGQQKLIDKYKYQGGKIEQRTEYYSLLMRKKETAMTTKLSKQKFGGGNSNSQTRLDITGLDLDNQR